MFDRRAEGREGRQSRNRCHFDAYRATGHGLPRRTQRGPSGTLEAITGGAEGLALAAKMGNSIERANALHRTYAPADEVAVQSVDELDCSVGGNFAS
jgi:hypothetical protein